jgi:hypothetical protein
VVARRDAQDLNRPKVGRDSDAVKIVILIFVRNAMLLKGSDY